MICFNSSLSRQDDYINFNMTIENVSDINYGPIVDDGAA